MGFEFDASKIPLLINIIERAIQDGREWGLQLLDEAQDKRDKRKISTNAIHVSTLWSIGTGIVTGFAGIFGIPADVVDAVYSQVKLSSTLFTINDFDTADESKWVLIVSAASGISVRKLSKYLGLYSVKALQKAFLPKSFRVIMRMNERFALKIASKLFSKNVVKTAKIIPAVGSIVGGTVNGVTMFLLGNAILIFIDEWKNEGEGEGGSFSLSPA